MRPSSSTLASVLAAVTLGSFAVAQDSSCATLHMIVARASTEAPGQGIIGAVVEMVQKNIPGSDSVAVQYPATLSNYFSSEGKGVTDMQQLVEDYANACPDGKMALFGYSQGAQVVGDTLCGRTENLFNPISALSQSVTKNIVAAVQMGDPSFVPGRPYDIGTANQTGIFPRTNGASCDPYDSIIQSYCDYNDLYCASGNSLAVHIGYVNKYRKQAAAFVEQQYNAAVGNGGSSSGSSMMSGTPTPTPTPSPMPSPSPMSSPTPTGGASTKSMASHSSANASAPTKSSPMSDENGGGSGAGGAANPTTAPMSSTSAAAAAATSTGAAAIRWEGTGVAQVLVAAGLAALVM